MIFHNEDIIRAYEEYMAEQGTDAERRPLLAIIDKELESVQATIERSPDLQRRGIAAICKDQQFRDIAILDGETIDEFVLRMRDEATERGHASVSEMMIEQTEENVVYWRLDVTRFVYVAHRRIGRVKDGGHIASIMVEQESLGNLEELIQGLRLLQTTFNGAIVE